LRNVPLANPVRCTLAGARVVPIHFNSTASQLAYLMQRLNGVLFTGGGTDLSPGSKFYATGRQIYDTAAAINANGDYFPLWGTCSTLHC
jgi:gamma-glutamyl hydrolase